MPRPQLTDEPVDKKISIRRSIYLEVEDLLHDPVRGRARYGGWSRLVNSLLEDWLEQRRREER